MEASAHGARRRMLANSPLLKQIDRDLQSAREHMQYRTRPNGCGHLCRDHKSVKRKYRLIFEYCSHDQSVKYAQPTPKRQGYSYSSEIE